MANSAPNLTPVPDPADAQKEAAAERTRAAARDATHWLRGEAQRLYEGYNRQSKFFKWRSWIVGAYATIAVGSVVMALPPMNTIDAYVVPTTDYSNRLILSVKNESGEEWTDVRLVLDGTWEFRKDRVGPGESILPNITQFQRIGTSDAAGKATEALRPKRLLVDTDQGSYEHPVYEEQ